MTPASETKIPQTGGPPGGAPGRLRRIVAQGVTKLFGSTPALRGASLTLESGSPLLLSGPNGAGKSTLLSILGTHLRPTRGQVTYLTEDETKLDKQQVRSRLGWVSHHSHCYGELSGKDNVLLAADLQGMDRSAYDAVADRVGLGAFALRQVGTLSRGQTQRVALARALIHGPELLLLDEPWTGLDRESSKLLFSILEEEKTKGTLIALVSHEADLASLLGAREVSVVRGKTENKDKDP